MPILHWLNRDDTLRVARETPYRLLEEDRALSFGDPQAANIVVQGDNLAALKSLLPYYAGQVKCIFIDPPYNTRSAFEHYDDNLEHSEWLHMMYPRLELLREFLREDGSLWMTIDDNEAHYLKVILDEVFGRSSFIATVAWQSRYSRSNDASLSISHNFVLVYSPKPERWKEVRNRLPRTEKQGKQYSNPDNDPRGPWRAIPWDAPNLRPNLSYPITTPTGRVRVPPPGRCWSRTEDQWQELVRAGLAYFGRSGDGAPSFKHYLAEAPRIVPNTWWPHEDAGHTDEAKKEATALFGADNPFSTPKPERLLQRILHIATDPGDLVLDSFLGSGTTAAVAHKMGRQYIGIEIGEHAVSHVVPRLRKVVEGEQGGISKAVGWTGGGGFRFFRLGEPVFDAEGRLNPAVSFSALAAHVWHAETGTPFGGLGDSPLLGIHEGTAYYLLYNGILGNKRPEGGNVLTHKVLASLPPHDGPKVIFGEARRIGEARLKELAVTFRQIPYDIKVR